MTEPECYLKIEMIVKTFEQHDLDVGHRHRTLGHGDIEWMKTDEKDADFD